MSRNTGRCTTCLRADVEIIHAKRRKGQTLRAISFEHGVPMTSLVRHFRHSGIVSNSDNNTEEAPIPENWRCPAADAPPEGADPLLWELGQLRKTAQGALAYAARTRNLQATASLLRSANGLLDLLARIEKAKAEEIKAQQATSALQDERALEAEFNQHLDRLAERLRQAQAAAPKCPRCGQALPYGVQVEEEEPKPDARGCIDEGRRRRSSRRPTRHWPPARTR